MLSAEQMLAKTELLRKLMKKTKSSDTRKGKKGAPGGRLSPLGEEVPQANPTTSAPDPPLAPLTAERLGGEIPLTNAEVESRNADQEALREGELLAEVNIQTSPLEGRASAELLPHPPVIPAGIIPEREPSRPLSPLPHRAPGGNRVLLRNSRVTIIGGRGEGGSSSVVPTAQLPRRSDSGPSSHDGRGGRSGGRHTPRRSPSPRRSPRRRPSPRRSPSPRRVASPPRREIPRRSPSPPRHQPRAAPVRAARVPSPGSAFIDALGLPTREYRIKMASAYLDLEIKVDRLLAYEVHRRITSLEGRVSNIEEFEQRLQMAEGKHYLVTELDSRMAGIEHRYEALKAEVRSLRASMGSIGTLNRMEEHIRLGEEFMARANEQMGFARQLGFNGRFGATSDRRGDPHAN